MTVEELIDELEKMPKDVEVLSNLNTCLDITRLEYYPNSNIVSEAVLIISE